MSKKPQKRKSQASATPRDAPGQEISQPSQITYCKDCFYLGTFADGSLHCRRMCPTISPTPSQSGMAVWPQVLATDWCAWGYSLTTNKWNTPSGSEPGS